MAVKMLRHRADRRFSPPEAGRKYVVKQVWDHHHEVFRRIVKGDSNVTIAEDMGITPATVSNLRNCPQGRMMIEELNSGADAEAAKMAERIQQFAPIALDFLEKVVSGKVPGITAAVRAKYADKHLGRVGFGEIKNVRSVNEHITRDELQEVKERARMSRAAIEGEYENVQ